MLTSLSTSSGAPQNMSPVYCVSLYFLLYTLSISDQERGLMEGAECAVWKEKNVAKQNWGKLPKLLLKFLETLGCLSCISQSANSDLHYWEKFYRRQSLLITEPWNYNLPRSQQDLALYHYINFYFQEIYYFPFITKDTKVQGYKMPFSVIKLI